MIVAAMAALLLAPFFTLGLYVMYLGLRYERATTGDKSASFLRLLKAFWIVALQPAQWERVMREASELGRSFVDDDLSEQAGFEQDGKIT